MILTSIKWEKDNLPTWYKKVCYILIYGNFIWALEVIFELFDFTQWEKLHHSLKKEGDERKIHLKMGMCQNTRTTLST